MLVTLQFLRILYENSTDNATLLQDVVPSVEGFLQHQSAVLNAKSDLLSAYRVKSATRHFYKASELLGPQDTVSLTMEYWDAQFKFQASAFQSQSQRYLPILASVNRFLRPLYRTAHDIEKNRNDADDSGASESSRESPGGPSSLRKRRRFSGPLYVSNTTRGARHTNAGNSRDDGEIARVQHQLDLNNQVADIAKKVELWRALARTIASACVISAEELALIDGSATIGP